MVKNDEKVWKRFLEKHFQMFVLFIVGAILAFIVAVRVFLWFVAEAQSTELVPMVLGEWSMGYLVTFILHLIFWGIIIVGIPVIIAIVAIYFGWWKKLPEKERKECKDGHLFGKHSRKSDGGGAISFLVTIAFIIIVYLDGNWDKAFATWKFDYLVYSYLWALIWVAIIFGIPMLIGGAWWIHHVMKK